MLVSSSIYLYLAVIYICIFLCSLGMAATCYYLMRMVSGDHKDGVFQQRMMRGRVGSQGRVQFNRHFFIPEPTPMSHGFWYVVW